MAYVVFLSRQNQSKSTADKVMSHTIESVLFLTHPPLSSLSLGSLFWGNVKQSCAALEGCLGLLTQILCAESAALGFTRAQIWLCSILLLVIC